MTSEREDALQTLRRSGISVVNDTIKLPEREPTSEEWVAINYLCDEHEFELI